MSEKLSTRDLHLLLDEPIYVLDKSISPDSTIAVEDNPAPKPIIQYKGGFEKKIIVLFQDESKQQISSENETFLLKIMSAVHLGPADIAILNIEEAPNWQESLEPDVVLGFGIESSPIALYELQNINECTHFYADSLSIIAEDVGFKRQLWEGLKKMFP